MPSNPYASLPSEGFIRQSDLIGADPITEEQAAANRRRGKGPVRPRPGRPGIVPFSSATLWRLVKRGEFPHPSKLSVGVTAWNAAAVRDWLNEQAEAVHVKRRVVARAGA